MRFETGTDYEVCRRWEGGWVADVVKVVVRPDYGGDVGAFDAES